MGNKVTSLYKNLSIVHVKTRMQASSLVLCRGGGRDSNVKVQLGLLKKTPELYEGNFNIFSIFKERLDDK